jgi:hypothetical protein
MSAASFKSITPGESRLRQLLQQLPTDFYWFSHEPRVNAADGQSSKPDFVVVNRNLGIIIVEVKDWTQIERGDQQLVTTRRFDGESMTYPNPLLTVERQAYQVKQRFEQRAELWESYRGRLTLRFPWQVMVVLPFIDSVVITQFEDAGVWPRGVVIGRGQLTDAKTLDAAIQGLPWRFQMSAAISSSTLDIIRETIEPSLVVETREGKPLGTLTPVQERLVKEPLHSAKPHQLPLLSGDFVPEETAPAVIDPAVQLVRGVAGSGKTLVLVKRVQQLARQHPEARLLVLTFNVDMANDLRERIGHPGNVEVLNFHRLCRSILQPYWADPLRAVDWIRRYARELLQGMGISADYAAAEFGWRKEMGLYDAGDYLQADRRGRGKRLDESQRNILNQVFKAYLQSQQSIRANREVWFDWDDVPFLTLETLEENPLQHSYDAVFVDEAQDFAPSWIQVCRQLVKPEGELFLCDDPSQSIFCAYTWQQKGLHIVGHSRVLRIPFRSTRAISRAAHSLIEADETLRSHHERTRPDLDTNALQEGQLPGLVICSGEHLELKWIVDRVNTLLNEGMPPRSVAILCHNRWHVKRWEALAQRGIYVQHFDRMKGLEFQAVFIPQVELAFPSSADPDTISVIRRKLFTAMTRAQTSLTLTCAGALPAPLYPLLPFVEQITFSLNAGD